MITHQDIRYLNRNHHAPTLFTPELLKSIIYFKEFIWFNKTDYQTIKVLSLYYHLIYKSNLLCYCNRTVLTRDWTFGSCVKQ